MLARMLTALAWWTVQGGLSSHPPLLLASGGGYEEIVRWLLHHGANVSVEDTSGRTAAHVAVAQQRWAVLKVTLPTIETLCINSEDACTEFPTCLLSD